MPRQSFRFSLRSFAVFALILALVTAGYAMRRDYLRQQYVSPLHWFDVKNSDNKLASLRGYYEVDFDGAIKLAVLRDSADAVELARLSGKETVERLAIVDDATFQQIDFTNYPKLGWLALTEVTLVAKDVQQLAALPELHYLCLTHFTGETRPILDAVEELKGVRTLIIRSNRLHSADQIPTFAQLESLVVESKHADDVLVGLLRERMPNCEIGFYYVIDRAGGSDRETLFFEESPPLG